MIRRTNGADLLLPFLVIGAAVYGLLRISYGSLPPFQWLIVLPIAVLAIVEVVMARRVRSAVRHDPNAKPMTAFAIARAVALAKASAVVAAAVAGAALALVLRVLPDANRTDAAAHDLRIGLALMVAAGALLAAALLLERSGIDPNSGTRR